MSKLMGYFVAAAVAASTTALFAAEPFIPVFITDGERNVTPAVFPELSVFRESIPSYPVNSSVKIKRFTPLSKAYKYPQEYVRRLSDEERRLTPYRFEEMFADPASTIDSEYARSGKPFFIYERISRPPYFLPRDGAPLAIRSSFEEWKKKHPGFLGFNSLWELDSDSTYFQRFYNNMKDASIEKELHEAFGPPDEKGMAHRRRWAEKVFKIAEDFHFGEKRIFPLCSNFPGYEHIFAALGAQGIWYEATTQSYGAWNTAGPIVRGAARQRGLDFGWYMAHYYPGFDRKGNRLIGDSRRHLSHDGSDAEPRPYRGESRSMHKRQMLYGWLIGAKYLQTEGWIQFYADKKDGKIIPSENALDFEEAYQRAKRIERGETFTTLAVLTPLDEPTASSYLNKNMIEPTVQADIFDTLVPIRGDSGTDIPKRKIGEQGCLFNSEFGGFFDVLCPDSGQDSAAFAQALSRYRHVLVAGNAFNKDKFDKAALAAFEKSGGKVHRYPSEECPTKDKLRELLLKIQDETMPVSVVGDIQWGVNKTSKGWLVWMINNKGVVKFSDEPEEFRKERTAHVVATFKATGEKFEADIAPGDFKLWEIVQATSAYKPAPAPLMTEWGAKMTPETAWRAYPRPQMTRPGWTCLNGLWKYAVTPVANTSGRPT